MPYDWETLQPLPACEAVLRRNPLRHTFGCYLSDSTGIGHFYWFQDHAELVCFLRSKAVLAIGEFSLRRLDLDLLRCEIDRLLSANRRIDIVVLSRLNGILGDLLDVRWIGSFDDLCEAPAAFCVGIRTEFLRRNGAEAAATMPVDLRAGFSQFVMAYGKRPVAWHARAVQDRLLSRSGR